jgi:hypothetical protein
VLHENTNLVSRRCCPQLVECGRRVDFIDKVTEFHRVSDCFKYHPRLSYTDKVFTICTKDSLGPISGNLTADASTIGEFGGVILAVVNESQLGLVESGGWLQGTGVSIWTGVSICSQKVIYKTCPRHHKDSKDSWVEYVVGKQNKNPEHRSSKVSISP